MKTLIDIIRGATKWDNVQYPLSYRAGAKADMTILYDLGKLSNEVNLYVVEEVKKGVRYEVRDAIRTALRKRYDY